jgi:hypothetical protein
MPIHDVPAFARLTFEQHELSGKFIIVFNVRFLSFIKIRSRIQRSMYNKVESQTAFLWQLLVTKQLDAWQ